MRISKLRIVSWLALLLITFSCNEQKISTTRIEDELHRLDTHEKQKVYLVDLYRNDQRIRSSVSENLEKFGYESEEHQNAIKQMIKVDENNLLKIEHYLQKYGHPKVTTHGEEACNTPWIIIHHATGGIEPRRRNFKYIYSAFKNGDIDDGALSFYLNRMYHKKFGNRISWDRPFRIEEELDTLFKSLDLEEIVNEIQKLK